MDSSSTKPATAAAALLVCAMSGALLALTSRSLRQLHHPRSVAPPPDLPLDPSPELVDDRDPELLPHELLSAATASDFVDGIPMQSLADLARSTSLLLRPGALALLLDHAAKDPHLAFLVESARQPDNSEKRRQAITVLQLMAKREVNRPTMIAAKVPELCCELLCQVPIDTDVERRDPVALKEAAVALYELMCQENALKNRLVHNSSLLLGISRIMTTEWHRELTSWAIFLLHNLAMSETLQRHLADHGALPMLGDALRTVYGNWTLQKLCFHALVRIIGSLDVPATQAAVARHLTPINIVGLMASALRSDDVELGYWSLGLIHECVLKDAGRAAIRSCPGLVRVISHKLDVADVGAAKLALRVLKFLGLRDPAFHAELIDTCGDIVPRVMALAGVREPSANGDTSPSENGSDECAYWATMLIHDLVSVPAGAAAALKHKDLPKLLAMAESNRTLVPMYVVDVVAALCSLPSLSATSLIRKYPALLAAVSTLARHSDPDVAANALACMYRLAMLSPAAVLAALRAYGAELSIATTMLDGGSADRIVEGNAGRTRIDVVGAKLIAMFVMAPIEHPVPSSSSNSDIARVLADSQIEQLDPDEIVEWIVDHILQPYVLGVVMGASHTVVSTISSASLGAPHAAGGDENDRVAGSSPVKGSFGQFGWSTAAEPSSAPTSATSNPTSPVFATQHEDPTLEDGDEHEHDHGMDSATGSPRSPLLGNNVNNGEGGVPLNIGLFINTGMPGAGPAETPHPTPISAPVSSNGSHRNVDISSPQVSAPTSAQSQDLARSASMMLLTHSSDRIDGALQAIEILSGFPRIMSTIFDRHMDIVEIFIDSVFDLVMLPLVTENMELKHDRPWIRGERGMDPMGALMAAQEEAVADLQEPFHGLKLAVAGQAMSALASLFQYEVIQQYLIEERFISTAIACLRMHPKTLASPVLTALARAAQHLSRNTILATPWLLDVCRLALAQSTDLHSPYASPSAQFAAAYILDRATNATPWIGHGDFIGMSRMDKSNGLMVSSSGTEVWNLSWAFESVRATHGACAGGRWMFEVDLYAPDLLQLGWATIDCTFDMTCGRGIGDDDHSYAFDGERSRVWHGASVHNEGIEYGRKWAAGDTVGCCIDLEEGVISFMLNGEDLGIAFEGIRLDEVWYPAISLTSKQGCKVRFGHASDPLKFPAEDYVAIGAGVNEGYVHLSPKSPMPAPLSSHSTNSLPLSPTRSHGSAHSSSRTSPLHHARELLLDHLPPSPTSLGHALSPDSSRPSSPVPSIPSHSVTLKSTRVLPECLLEYAEIVVEAGDGRKACEFGIADRLSGGRLVLTQTKDGGHRCWAIVSEGPRVVAAPNFFSDSPGTGGSSPLPSSFASPTASGATSCRGAREVLLTLPQLTACKTIGVGLQSTGDGDGADVFFTSDGKILAVIGDASVPWTGGGGGPYHSPGMLALVVANSPRVLLNAGQMPFAFTLANSWGARRAMAFHFGDSLT